jgi:hypothetical protein
MSFASMTQELLGIPGTNLGLIKSKINEAFTLIQDENVWSFQLQSGGWLSPGLLGGYTDTFLSPGTISIQPFTNQMTGDAVATAAWYSANQPIITQYQIRVPYYDLYNIIAINGNGTIAYATIVTAGSGQTPGTYTVPVLDNGGSGSGASVSITVAANGTVEVVPTVISAGSNYLNPYIAFSEGGTPATFTVTQIAVLTLDRLWTSPAQVNSGYMAYQAYFPLPAGYRRTYAIRDLVNNQPMNWDKYTQVDLAIIDPQRTDFSQPEYVVYVGPDMRPGSATYGQGLVELWQGPITQLPYACQWQVNWPPLVNPNDTVPPPLTEELLKFRAYEVISLWKESQKGDEMERGSGANWQFLAKYYHDEYLYCLKRIRVADRNIADLYFQKMNRNPINSEPFASVTGQLSVGS